MAPTAIRDGADATNAFSEMARNLRQGARQLRKPLGWKGGADEFTVYWRAEEGFWSVLEDGFAENRYWCCFGTGDPDAVTKLSIACEINPPFTGINLRTTGMFIRGEDRAVYLAYTGNVHGGRKGIGKAAFLDWYGSDGLTEVRLPDGRTTSVIVIGRIESPRFPAQIARLVRQVERFKVEAASGRPAPFVRRMQHQFRPEFSGRRRGYTVTGTIEAQCDHGLVIDALAQALHQSGLQIANDRRDMFVLAEDETVRLLFEAKTDLSTTSIYTGIGQLMFHGALQMPPPRRVLVVPDEPNDQMRTILRQLGIELVSYEWEGPMAVFSGLDDILRQS
jgi:hypothetical protein